jgi:ELWxxDGT repeat protein
LFKSDGTNSGTNVLKDQWQGSQIEWFQFVNGKLFQSSHDKTNKIWYTNGTPTGTYVIYDLLGTFPSASICSDLIYLNNYVYFITKEYDNVWGNITHKICRSNANFQNIDVVHQWSNTFSQGTWFKFDNVLTNVIIGTGNGTWSLNTLNNSVFQLSSDLTIFGNVSKVYYNNKIYYSKNNNLYSIDGTNSGVTDLQIGIPIRELVVFNNLIYFSGGSIGTGQSGIELYKTNGTPLNTSLVSDIFFGFNSSEPRDFNVVNNKLFFVGNSINDITIYCYDPILNNVLNTSATTLVEISDRKTQLVGFNNLLYYSAPVSSWDIWKLWETNGTSNSAILTQNIDLTKDSACIGDFYVVNNKLFFVACDSQHGQELWSSVTNNSLGMGLEENVNFSIFPNPTSHSITIKGEKNMNQSFSIFDQMGREVFKGKLIGTETEVNLSSLSKGIYTLKIDGNYQPTQIVKE